MNERRVKERRKNKERREHDMDDLYEQALRRKIVQERRKMGERRNAKRRETDKARRYLKEQVKRPESDFLNNI
jgi:hypothetical protein